MGVPGNANALLLRSAAAAGGYQVSRSLRFNSSDSGFLSRTPSTAGNRRTWTWAGWVKRSSLTSARNFLLGCGPNSNDFFAVEFTSSSDALIVQHYAGGTQYLAATTQVFRDASAWLHLVLAVDTTQAVNADRVKVYINGVQVTAFSTYSTWPQNLDTNYNRATTTLIGNLTTDFSGYFNGYLADIHFIDGQALTPSSFTEVSATTGQLIPKQYTGSFGTNGFWLKFSDNSAATATTLGKDYSGNSNNWTPNNLSVTAGAGNDSLVDTPTSYGTDTGAGGEVRGNYATLNPLSAGAGATLSNGNLDLSTDSANVGQARSSIGVSSGKWYFEVVKTGGSANPMIGIVDAATPTSNFPGQSSGSYGYYGFDGKKYNNNSPASYGASYGTNDVIGIALDLDAGTLVFYKNGVSQGTAYSSLTGTFFPAVADDSGSNSLTVTVNFGQRPFAYTAPSGFKALVDTNLTAPVIAKPSSAFDCVTYTGTGATLTPTSSLGFSPDLVWIKSRSAATDHTIYDAVRGTQARLESNNTDPEVTSDGGLTAFNSNGFTLGTLAQVNTNAATYVAWCWDEAAADGFDIVTYTGNGANRTIAHSLGVAPSFMIVKQRTAASATNWAVWHSSLANTEYLLLNSTAAKATGATYWNSTSPTSTNFSLGTAADVNTNNGTYVAYLWSSVVGYSAIGSYVGNSSADGPFVYTGFRPRFIMVKNAEATTDWVIIDTARETFNVVDDFLRPNLSAAEGTRANLAIDILSNGFKHRGLDNYLNGSNTHVYIAFAESPFQFSRAR